MIPLKHPENLLSSFPRFSSIVPLRLNTLAKSFLQEPTAGQICASARAHVIFWSVGGGGDVLFLTRGGTFIRLPFFPCQIDCTFLNNLFTSYVVIATFDPCSLSSVYYCTVKRAIYPPVDYGSISARWYWIALWER